MRHALARLGSARLGSARLGSARLGQSVAPHFRLVKSHFVNLTEKSLAEAGCIAHCLGLFAFWGKGGGSIFNC